MDLDYAMDLMREVYTLAMSGEPISATDALVAPYLDEPSYSAACGDEPISDRWSAYWWEYAGRNLAVDPTPYIEQFDGPALWSLGELDDSVPLVPTRAALERAFSAASGDDHEIIVLDEAPIPFSSPVPTGHPGSPEASGTEWRSGWRTGVSPRRRVGINEGARRVSRPNEPSLPPTGYAGLGRRPPPESLPRTRRTAI